MEDKGEEPKKSGSEGRIRIKQLVSSPYVRTGIHMQLTRTAAAKTDVHRHGRKYGNLTDSQTK